VKDKCIRVKKTKPLRVFTGNEIYLSKNICTNKKDPSSISGRRIPMGKAVLKINSEFQYLIIVSNIDGF
jgi:hypothetical protein